MIERVASTDMGTDLSSPFARDPRSIIILNNLPKKKRATNLKFKCNRVVDPSVCSEEAPLQVILVFINYASLKLNKKLII